MRIALRAALLAALLALGAGCSNLGYYAQAVKGQVEIWHLSRPIPEVLEDPDTPPAVKDRLARAEAIRDFASRDLGLPDNGSYREYADLGRPYVVWNVFAAPEFSLTLKTWCFPFAGCVGYRGYFSKDGAEAFARGLREEGYDVYVGGVPAYSTLGWFDDPILNTFLSYSDLQLAGYLFHELAHQELYVKGDTEFNESFATAVAREGVKRWIAATGSGDAAEEAQVERRRQEFLTLVLDFRKRLEALYASDVPADEKRDGKARIIAELREAYLGLRQSWGGYGGYDRWFAQDLNNAKLGSVAAYARFVPAFEALLAEEGGDFPRFYAAVKALGDLPKTERHARLEALARDRTAGGGAG